MLWLWNVLEHNREEIDHHVDGKDHNRAPAYPFDPPTDKDAQIQRQSGKLREHIGNYVNRRDDM